MEFIMEVAEFEKYLEERYYPQIKWYDMKALSNQSIYKILQWIVIILAAVTPVLVAIGGTWERCVAIVISALVAIGTSVLKTFKYQENWINYRTTCETLRKEIHYYNASINDYESSNDPMALFVERVEALISRENTLWLTVQKKKTDNKN
jgi:hypothetical protein